MIYPNPAEVVWTNKDRLRTYQFNTKVLDHKFCPECGTSVIAEPNDRNKYRPDEWLVLNVS